MFKSLIDTESLCLTDYFSNQGQKEKKTFSIGKFKAQLHIYMKVAVVRSWPRSILSNSCQFLPIMLCLNLGRAPWRRFAQK